jgi:hypothetical protein
LKNILLGMSDVSAKCSRENRKTYLKWVLFQTKVLGKLKNILKMSTVSDNSSWENGKTCLKWVVSDKSSRENWKTYFLEWVMFQPKVLEKIEKHT